MASSVRLFRESDLKYRIGQTIHYKAQTRLWGYNLKDVRRSSEFTDITNRRASARPGSKSEISGRKSHRSATRVGTQAEINFDPADRLARSGRRDR